MAKKEERFEVTFRDGSQLKDEGVRQILVDKETGVNYLCWKSGYGAAITPLLDSEGKVIVKVKSEVVVKEVYNGVLDFYVDYGFASSIYDDWFWKIFYEKGSKGNKFSIWISDFDVYEEQRHMGICS